VGPCPNTPTPNPQSPIPNPHIQIIFPFNSKIINILNQKKIIKKLIKIIPKKINFKQ
jgi:hypothetical protein